MTSSQDKEDSYEARSREMWRKGMNRYWLVVTTAMIIQTIIFLLGVKFLL